MCRFRNLIRERGEEDYMKKENFINPFRLFCQSDGKLEAFIGLLKNIIKNENYI